MSTLASQLTLIGLATGLVGTLTAQGTLTTPKIGQSTEAAFRFDELGGKTSSTRLMLIDGHHIGGKTRILNGVAFRSDRASTSSARSFSGVTLTMFHGDVATATTSFAQNISSTPTQVFSGSVSWPAAPSANSYPKSRPFDVKIPFSTIWAWDGKGAIGADLAMPVMTNGAGTYQLDGMWGAVTGTWPGRSHVYGTKNCVDSSLATGASAYARVGLYPPFEGTNAGKFRFQAFATDLPKSHPAIFSFNLMPLPAGVDLGVACNKLWVAPIANILIGVNSDSNGKSLTSWTETWSDWWLDKRLVAQAAWVDTKTNALKLTEGGGVNFGPRPVGGKYLNSKAFWAASATATTAISDRLNRFPVVQWSHL